MKCPKCQIQGRRKQDGRTYISVCRNPKCPYYGRKIGIELELPNDNGIKAESLDNIRTE